VLPFPGNSAIHTHLLLDDVDAKDEVYPGYTQMLLTFLENDIEVVDFLDEMREAAGSDVPVHWPNDPHTGPAGRRVAAQRLAERLQRYDFARKRKPVADAIQYETIAWTGAKTGWSTYLLNARTMSDNRKDPLEGTNIPHIMDDMAKRPMARYEMHWPEGHGNTGSDGFYDLALVGDSQLHSPVVGAGLPAFMHAAVGGICRWGSKSWSGFSLPEIYLETVTNEPVQQPRVIAVFHLFFKLPAKEKSEYAPRPLPPMGAVSVLDPNAQPFNARVKILKFSKPRDPRTVDYKEALMQGVGEIVDGPMKGETIGFRHEVMHNGRLAKSFEKGRHPRILGKVVNLRLVPWDLAMQQDKTLKTTMVYDGTDLDLLAPLFWVAGGPLDRHAMRSR
jgi:hypothetical protein